MKKKTAKILTTIGVLITSAILVAMIEILLGHTRWRLVLYLYIGFTIYSPTLLPKILKRFVDKEEIKKKKKQIPPIQNEFNGDIANEEWGLKEVED